MTNALSQQSAGHSYEKDQVVQIINSVLNKTKESTEAATASIYKEIQALHDIIENARKDLSAAGAADISQKHIPTATDELDAIVEATASATGTIMDCCDVIQEKAGAAGGENGDAIVNEVTKIYEACSFQDITGQRITKVVKTLQDIESKVDAILGAISAAGGSGSIKSSGSGEDTRTEDEKLLNGPQMPDQAIKQEDIDKILAEFD